MLQAKLLEPKKIIFEEVKIPKVKDNDALIEIRAVGICGSDIHTYKGAHPFVKKYPLIQGHEFSGVIAKVGRSVRNLKIGQKVTAEPSLTCGKCFNCLNNRYNICENLKVMGFQTDGAMRNYFAVPEYKVIPLLGNVNYNQGAMIEPLAVATHSIKRAGKVNGKNILVLGAGTIGILTSAVAKCFGAKKVIITDVSDFRLEYAKKINIDYLVNVEKENLKDKIYKYFGNNGADIIFECVGVADTINQCINISRKGIKIIVAGVFSEKVEIDAGLIQDKELELIGTLMYQKDDFKSAINLIHKKKIDPTLLITHKFSFEKLPDAYDLIEHEKENFLKVMIEFG